MVHFHSLVKLNGSSPAKLTCHSGIERVGEYGGVGGVGPKGRCDGHSQVGVREGQQDQGVQVRGIGDQARHEVLRRQVTSIL